MRDVAAKAAAFLAITASLPPQAVATAHALQVAAEKALPLMAQAGAAFEAVAETAHTATELMEAFKDAPAQTQALVKAGLALADHFTRVGTRASVATQELTGLVHTIRTEGVRISFPPST
jgi:hypothetical protein